MTWAIPRETIYTFERGARNVGVWALQVTLNQFVQMRLGTDGDFGPATENAVILFQAANGLEGDGVAGPITQAALSHKLTAREEAQSKTPAGLLRGFTKGESGDLFAAVNHSSPGGVDCGLFQRRVYEPDYDSDAVIERAFNAGYQCDLLAQLLVNLRSIFLPRAGTRDGAIPAREKAWRLAALNHNYPAGADRLSRTPVKDLPGYWTTAQSWVTDYGFKFPDGKPLRTPLDWCHAYAGVLGAGVHSTDGSVTRYVVSWP